MVSEESLLSPENILRVRTQEALHLKCSIIRHRSWGLRGRRITCFLKVYNTGKKKTPQQYRLLNCFLSPTLPSTKDVTEIKLQKEYKSLKTVFYKFAFTTLRPKVTSLLLRKSSSHETS